MAIKFDITGDNSNFLGALQGAENGVRNTARTIEAAGGDIEDVFSKIRTAAAGAFAGFSASQIVKTITETRGQFQQLEVAFQTMLGSAKQAQTMMQQMTTLAATTPFDLKGVAGGAKQLLAYGVQANKITDTLRRLGDVAAGLSIPLDDLVYLYGTTMAQGRMYTQDLNQFTGRGIPMIQELAKQFGVAEGQVKDLVTAGKVGFPQVEKAIEDLTNQGGKFGGLMEAQSHTITGQISNIEDTIDMMFNDIGKQNEGIINDSLSLVSTLVDHWKEVAQVVGTVVVAYGLYKGALMTTIALERSREKLNFNTQAQLLDKEIAATRALIVAKGQAKNADLAEMVAKKQLTEAQAEEIAQKRELLATTKQEANASQMSSALDAQIAALQALTPAKEASANADLQEAVASGTLSQAQAQEIATKRELLATLTQEAEARVASLQAKAADAQASYDAAVQNQAAASMELENADAAVSAAQEALEAAMESGNADEVSAAQTELKTAVDNQSAAAEAFKAAQAEVSTAAIEMNTTAEAANSAQTELNTTLNAANAASKGGAATATTASTAATGANTIAMRLNAIATQAGTIAQGIFAAAVNSVKMAWNGLKVAMMTNPIGLILTGLTVAISLFTSFADSEDDATDANKRFGDSMTKASSDVESLYAVLESSTTTSKVHKDAVEQLSQKAEEYGLKLDSEKDKTEQLIEKKQELIGLIKEESIERQKANDIQTATDEYQKKIEDIKNDLKDSLSDDLSDVQKNQLVNLISDEDIKNLRDKMEAMNKAMEESVAKTGSWNSRFSTDQIQAYNDAVAKLTNRVGIYSEKLGLSSSETTKNKNAVKDQTTAMAEASIKMQRTINATQAAADAAYNAASGADTMTNAERTSAVQTSYLRQSVDDLYSSIATLLKNYKNNNINFTLTLDTTQVPAWMKQQLGINGKGGKQKVAHANASFWAAQLDRINKTHAKGIWVNGGKGTKAKWYSSDTVATRAAQYAVADSTISKDTAAANVSTPKTKTTKTKSGKSGKDDSAQRAESIKEENENWSEEQKKQKHEAYVAQREADIADIKDNAEKERAERELQYEKDLYQLDEQKREFQKQNYEHNKKIYENSAKGNKNKYGGTIEGTALTKDQQTQIDAQREKIETDWNTYQAEQLAQNTDMLYDYLSKYGSVEAQKYAITKQYDEKLAKEGNEYKKKELEREKQQALSSAEANAMKEQINYSAVFSDFGIVFRSEMEKALDQMKAYSKTDDFKKMNAKDQADYLKIISDTESKYNGYGFSLSFKKVGTAMDKYRLSLQHQQSAQKELERTQIAVAKAQEAYNKVLIKGTDAEKKKAKADLDSAKQQSDEAQTNVNNANNEVATAQTNVSESASKLKNSLESVNSILSAMSSHSLKSVWDALGEKTQKKVSDTVAKALGKAFQGKSDLVSLIIGAILNLLDTIKEQGIGGIVGGFVESVLDAVAGLIKNILSGKFISQIAGGVFGGIKNILNSVVGGLGHLFSGGALKADVGSWFTNSNAKEVAKTTEDLTTSNNALNKSIESLKDSIDKSGGVAAVNDYQQAYEDQKALNQNTMEILQAQMGYHGSHHSNAYYWNKSIGQSDYDAINKTLAQYAAQNPTAETTRNSVNSLADMYELTPEQMKAISAHNVDIWQKMLDAGKYDKSEYWENYIELAGQLEELTEKINENLTQVSFDSLKENFVSDIMDMTKTASDFSSDFTQMIAKAWTNAAVNDLMNDDLKKFYTQWADKMKSGTMTKEDIDALKKEYDTLAQQALNIRENMTQVTGYTGTDQQNASANGISEISYDQANTIVGLVTAGNVITQQISENMVVAVASMSAISMSVTSSNSILSEMRNLLIYSNQYLEDIAKYAKNIFTQFSDKLDKEYLLLEKIR